MDLNRTKIPEAAAGTTPAFLTKAFTDQFPLQPVNNSANTWSCVVVLTSSARSQEPAQAPLPNAQRRDRGPIPTPAGLSEALPLHPKTPQQSADTAVSWEQSGARRKSSESR